LAEFARCYAFGRELAKEVGSSPRSLIARLAMAGVSPVSGPSIDGSRQYLFERTDALRGIIVGEQNRLRSKADAALPYAPKFKTYNQTTCYKPRTPAHQRQTQPLQYKIAFMT
jgi:hypothetical protein